jgi:hypothetical protein
MPYFLTWIGKGVTDYFRNLSDSSRLSEAKKLFCKFGLTWEKLVLVGLTFDLLLLIRKAASCCF